MIPIKEFKQAVNLAVIHTSGHSPDLNHVFFDLSQSGTLLVHGCTWQQLASISLAVSHPHAGSPIFALPTAAAKELLAKLSGERVTVALFDGQIMFTDGIECLMYADGRPTNIPDFTSLLGRMPPEANGEARFDAVMLADMLLNARKLLVPDRPTVRLRIAGEGPLYIQLIVVLPVIRSATLV